MKNKFYKLLLVTALLPFFIIAQDFDESFLKSLPSDVAEDLVRSSKDRSASEETQYRRPSSYIEKPEPTSSRFGAKVFSMMQSSLMPLNEPNFDGSYVLDFGDQLELQIVGQNSSTRRLDIRRDGSVNIQDIGKVFIAGLSLETASSLIKSKINESFIGLDAYVTLINVRDIQVIIAGNVFNPGSYTLNGNSNIFHALSVSWGPSEGGSFRSIKLYRDGELLEVVDLYQTFIFGKSNFKSRLISGDLIFVDPVANVVNVTGAFKRPAEFELLNNENLSNAIKFANGLNKFADLENIILYRILDGEVKKIKLVNLSQLDGIISRDGDMVYVRGFPFNTIKISGEVLNPSTFYMTENSSILDAINKAGGFTNNAYPFGLIYLNKSAKEISISATELLYNKFLESIVKSMTQGMPPESLSILVDLSYQLKETPPSGRLPVDLQNESTQLPLLQDGDEIIVPAFKNLVYVFGEVAGEGPTIYKEGEDIA